MLDLVKLNGMMAKQLDYYNNDNGIVLSAIPVEPYRAQCCNLAWCMINADRFMEYLNKSDCWHAKVITSARHFIRDPSNIIWGEFDTKEYKKFRMDIRDYLMNTIGRKFIYRNPCQLDFKLDCGTINMMLTQAEWNTIEEIRGY